jgi:hypothetical protein
MFQSGSVLWKAILEFKHTILSLNPITIPSQSSLISEIIQEEELWGYMLRKSTML